jgi:hypothetical protein
MQNPQLWVDMRSRMSRETHVRICGGPGGEIPLGYSTVDISNMFVAIWDRSTTQNSDVPTNSR